MTLSLFDPTALASAWFAYATDAAQRSVLFWDALRQRGNVHVAHERDGKPPVLIFAHDVVLDGRTLPDPANYALLRIRAPTERPTDPGKRPFVVIDPRAGHGPGIGGFKMDSQIGLALQGGHPCYFVSFFPQPEPGQTLCSVAAAEIAFLEKVIALHPEADGKPLVIGNCQGGWAAALVASVRPDLVGPLLLAGSPLSYWAGIVGRNPMRYTGGLTGGSWTASLMSDLGAGKFDGGLLVSNFESLDPANTYWRKWYGLYSRIDTELPRFLEFERWWGGHFMLNKAEMDAIVQDLFIGNKLTSGELRVPGGGDVVDMRAIRSPIIVFASWGDTITPPPQALNWIADLYASVDDIVAHDQTIVYCLHDSVGHLGIFVSGKIATRETTELFDALDLIDVLPPGLWEAVIEDKRPDLPNADLIDGRYLIRFEPRDIADILALDDGREDEKAFAAVRRVSEINQAVYDRFLSPTVRAITSPATATLVRLAQTDRLSRVLWSDLNPATRMIEGLAGHVRAMRHPAAASNPFLAMEQSVSRWIIASLDFHCDLRDHASEAAFKAIYESPLLAPLLGLPDAAQRPGTARRVTARQEQLATVPDTGTPLDGFLRMVLFQGIEDWREGIDERPYALLRRLVAALPAERRPRVAEIRAALRRQFAALRADPVHALAGLDRMIPPERRRESFDIVRRVASARRGGLSAGQSARMAQLEEAIRLRAAAE
jgi:pimeloyl-ACP methyl ester carboxylesterase